MRTEPVGASVEGLPAISTTAAGGLMSFRLAQRLAAMGYDALPGGRLAPGCETRISGRAEDD